MISSIYAFSYRLLPDGFSFLDSFADGFSFLDSFFESFADFFSFPDGFSFPDFSLPDAGVLSESVEI